MSIKKDITILVVEDERPLVEAIAKKLENNGFTILSARNVDQALNYLRDDDVPDIDAVWLDHYLLGEKSGLDFLGECRSKGGVCKDIPIFVVTNTGGHEKKQTYMELGATKYYIKSNHLLNEIVGDIRSQLEESTE